MTYHNPYANNITFESPAKQVAFLFRRIAQFVEQAEEYRREGEFEAFAHSYQRAFGLVEGLLSWLNAEIAKNDPTKGTGKEAAWDDYCRKLVTAMNRLVMEYEQTIYEALQENLKIMANIWIDNDITLSKQLSDTENWPSEHSQQSFISEEIYV